METPNFERANQRRFWNACLQLHYAGLGVSAQKVHAKVGGSLRDIQPVVAQFQEKAKQFAELEAMPLPEELEQRVHNTLRTVAVQIWSEARELASADVLQTQAEMDELKKAHEKEVAELRAELEKWRKEAGKLDVDMTDLKAENASLKAQNDKLRDALADHKAQTSRLETALAESQKRAAEAQSVAVKAGEEKATIQAERNLLAARVADLEAKAIDGVVDRQTVEKLQLELKYQAEKAARLEERLEHERQGPKLTASPTLVQRPRSKVIHRKMLRN